MKNSEKPIFRAFCVGLPRSGTHLVNSIFSAEYRSSHEPLKGQTISAVLDWLEGNIEAKILKDRIKARDKYLNLNMECSHYLHHISSLLSDCFPDSKFLVTVRHPYEWVESEININYKTSFFEVDYWRKLECARYSKYRCSYSPHEFGMKKYARAYPLASYLLYWRDHINHMMNSVPKEKTLFIKTEDILEKLALIEDFLEISLASDWSENLDFSPGYKYFLISSLVDEGYLRKKISDICGSTLSKFWG